MIPKANPIASPDFKTLFQQASTNYMQRQGGAQDEKTDGTKTQDRDRLRMRTREMKRRMDGGRGVAAPAAPTEASGATAFEDATTNPTRSSMRDRARKFET
jgi:hypothetical protein